MLIICYTHITTDWLCAELNFDWTKREITRATITNIVTHLGAVESIHVSELSHHSSR